MCFRIREWESETVVPAQVSRQTEPLRISNTILFCHWGRFREITRVFRFEFFTSILAPGVARWCEWVMLGINRPHRAQCGTGQRLDEIFGRRSGGVELTRS